MLKKDYDRYKDIVEKLKPLRPIKGKKTFLTVSFPPDSTTGYVTSVLDKIQGKITRRDKVRARLIEETMKAVINEISTLKGSLTKGGVLFCGIVYMGGRKVTIFEWCNLLEGYEKFHKGKLDTKFHVTPLEGLTKNYDGASKRDVLKKFGEISKLINSKSDPKSLNLGFHPVKEDVSSGRAKLVIVTERISEFVTCQNCGNQVRKDSNVCDYCQEGVGAHISQLDEIQDLCKKNNVEFHCFPEEIGDEIDKKFYSILCIRRY